MKLKDFQDKISTIKRGTFTKAEWQSVKEVNGSTYAKVSKGVVRFVQYAHIKGVVAKGQGNPNESAIVPSALYHNSNTGSYLVQMATTKVKAKTKYFINGQEVSKATFETGVPPKASSGERPIFRVKLDNLISLGA